MYYSVNDAVNLTLLLKNVPELEIRIYQIDCKEYFLRFKDRVGLDIPLDGLSPNHVLNKTYEDPALSQRTSKIICLGHFLFFILKRKLGINNIA